MAKEIPHCSQWITCGYKSYLPREECLFNNSQYPPLSQIKWCSSISVRNKQQMWLAFSNSALHMHAILMIIAVFWKQHYKIIPRSLMLYNSFKRAENQWTDAQKAEHLWPYSGKQTTVTTSVTVSQQIHSINCHHRALSND